MKSIYELNNEEISRLSKEFNNTKYGRIARLWSLTIPVSIIVVNYFIFMVLVVINAISESFNAGSYGFDYIPLYLPWLCISVAFVGLGISQMQYGKMLKEYYELKGEIKVGKKTSKKAK